MNGSAERGGLGVLFLVVAVACTPIDDGRVGRVHQGIVFGEPSPAGGVEDAVLLLRTSVDGGEVLCSASLVAKNLALTARHCVAHVVQGRFDCTPRGELVDNPDAAGTIGADLPADSIELYGGATPRKTPLARGERIVSTLSDTVCLNDIAFIVLDRDVPIAPLALRLERTTRIGEKTVLVGYGLTENQADIIDFQTQPRLRKPDLPIADIGPDSIDDGVVATAPRMLVLEGPSACVADSGGPLLSAAHAVVGVYSSLYGVTCVDRDARNEFVHVPPFGGLIEEAFQAAGATPLAESAVASDGGRDGPDASAEPESAPSSSAGGCAAAPRRAVEGAASGAPRVAAALIVALAARPRRRRWPAHASAASF